jgi:hypothetical protein
MSNFLNGFDKLTDTSFRITLAYLVLMTSLGSLCVFIVGDSSSGFGIIDSERFPNSLELVRFSIAGLCLLIMLFITYLFIRKVFFGINPDNEQILIKAFIQKFHFPTIISDKNDNLKILLYSRSAKEFYGDKKLKKRTYRDLDSFIADELDNKEQWLEYHKKRLDAAEKGELDSTTMLTMKFKSPKMGKKEWRLTSSPIRLANRNCYFTIISPAKEDDLNEDK